MKKEYSYSQVQKFSTCGKMYEYHYKQRIRPMDTSSALVFGKAIDEALNAILLNIKNQNTDQDYKKILHNALWANPEQEIRWGEKDYEPHLLNMEDSDMSIFEKIRNYNMGIEKDSYPLIRNGCLKTLEQRGLLLLEHYIKTIVPRIEKVLEVQKKIELIADEETSFIGIIDAVILFKGHEQPTLIDHKTSNRPYPETSVSDSQQLAGYAFALNLSKVGYIVLLKDIRGETTKTCQKCGNVSLSRAKTCDKEVGKVRCHGVWEENFSPKPEIQFLIDEVNPSIQKVVVENISEVVNTIERGIFNRNLTACGMMYGQPCPYRSLCFYNQMGNLKYVEHTEPS